MKQTTLKEKELTELSSHVHGEVIRPGDGEYEGARRVWNGLIDRLPNLIVRCRTGGDVSRAVRFARERGLSVTVRAKGHNVAGLAIHGGIGWLVRKHGMSVDNLRAAEVVTTEGESVRASTRENPDLLWALKGGGGGFGVVTVFEFDLHAVGPDV